VIPGQSCSYMEIGGIEAPVRVSFTSSPMKDLYIVRTLDDAMRWALDTEVHLEPAKDRCPLVFL